MKRDMNRNKNRYTKAICLLLCLICSVCLSGCSSGKKNTEELSKDSDSVEAKAEPKTPADEKHDEEDVEIKDPAEAPVSEEVTGITDAGGRQVIESLAGYGFSPDEVMEAPDGSSSWFLQNGNYSCDVQTDANGNVYNAIFTGSGEDYADFFKDCAKAFGSDVENWVTENVNVSAETKIDSFSVSISEGPGGHSLQVCSPDYKNMVVGPEGAEILDGPGAPGTPGTPEGLDNPGVPEISDGPEG